MYLSALTTPSEDPEKYDENRIFSADDEGILPSATMVGVCNETQYLRPRTRILPVGLFTYYAYSKLRKHLA